MDVLLFVGDSISAQLHFAAIQRSAARGGPEIRWLLTAGPAFNAGWPEPLPQFIDEPSRTAIITSFGVWQAVPPEHVADLIAATSRAELLAEIEAFLAPLAAPDLARTTQVLLLHSIDHPPADAKLQTANSMIVEVAEVQGLPVSSTLPGTDSEGNPAFVVIEGQRFPVRNTRGDETHYCAAAALVMADEILDDLGVLAKSPTLADLDDLYALTPENYFEPAGC